MKALSSYFQVPMLEYRHTIRVQLASAFSADVPKGSRVGEKTTAA